MFERLEAIYPALPEFAAPILLLLGALVTFWFAREVLVRAVHRFAGYTAHTWDDALIAHRVPSRLAQLLPV